MIQYNSKVIDIKQDAKGVTVTYVDTIKGGPPMVAKADYCICTIPISVLKQLDIQVSAPFKAAMDQVSYAPVNKIGLQMKRRCSYGLCRGD